MSSSTIDQLVQKMEIMEEMMDRFSDMLEIVAMNTKEISEIKRRLDEIETQS